MFAAMRDHAMREMMVLLSNAVECSAKIAMMALLVRLATTRLLPEHELQRRNFLSGHATRICSS
jgi:hypothetical protein